VWPPIRCSRPEKDFGAAVAARRNANATTAVLVNIASEHPSPARRQSGDKYADWK
jgi:hypothetical protein